MKLKVIIFTLLLGLSFSAKAQLFDLLGDEEMVEIPFRFEGNFIIVKVQLNGAFPLNFIFDTGAEHTLLFKKTFTDLLGVPYDKKIKIFGSDLQNYVYAYIVRNIQFRVPPIDDVRMDFLVMEHDYVHMDEMIGMNIDGILGAQYFRHHVVKIDYQRGILTMYKKDKFSAPGKKYIPYPIDLKRNKPYVVANSRINQIDSAELTLLIDTGAGIGLMLHSNTHEHIKLPDNYIQTNLGLGIGGEIKGYMGRVAKFNFSNFTFSNVIAGFQDIALEAVEDKVIKRNGIIGNQILSRFTLILDYPNSIIYFKPLRKFKESFEYDKSGLSIGATGTYLNDFRVIHVLENSPGQEAGILQEDRILKINGIPTSFYNLARVTRILRGKTGKKITLKIQRGDEKLTKKFILRKIL
jgi:predicted aspartyl protease